MPENVPNRVIERIAAYRRHLRAWQAEGRLRIFSHDLAALEGATAAQVRRDLMTIGYAGSPSKGYDVAGLIEHINGMLCPSGSEQVVIVGVGHVGGAVANYLNGRHPEHRVAAAFDASPELVGRVLHGCRCYAIDELESVLAHEDVAVGIITVPSAAAQEVAERLVRLGIRGLVNFAPVHLRVPPGVHVENVDIAISLEKAAFFARAAQERREAQ